MSKLFFSQLTKEQQERVVSALPAKKHNYNVLRRFDKQGNLSYSLIKKTEKINNDAAKSHWASLESVDYDAAKEWHSKRIFDAEGGKKSNKVEEAPDSNV